MRYINTILFLTFFLLISSKLTGESINQLNIQFETSEFYSRFIFAQSLGGSAGTSPTLKLIYDESKFAQKKSIQDAVKKIEQINTFYEYKFEGYPKYRFNGIQLWQLLKIAAANSKDINDFSARITGMLPVNDMLDLIESLKTLEHVHKQLVWKPNKKKLNKYLKKLRTEARKGDFDNDFQKAAKFYGTNWNPALPFKVYILPVPEFAGPTYEVATPEGNVLTFSTSIKENSNLAKDLAVIFHELCHILYQNQPAEIQHNQEELFLNASSQYKIIAYQVLDEALATALGQGWYYKQLKGELDDDIWYSVEQIDNVSKAIYNLVEEYADNDKTLDATFINRYLELYEDKFEDALFEVNSNISNINILRDEFMTNSNPVFPYFFKNFDMRSIESFDPIDEQNFLDWENMLGTKMIIVDANSESYDYLSQKIAWLPEINNPKDILYTNIVEGEQYYILIISDLELIGKAFELLNKKKKIKNTLEEINLNG